MVFREIEIFNLWDEVACTPGAKIRVLDALGGWGSQEKSQKSSFSFWARALAWKVMEGSGFHHLAGDRELMFGVGFGIDRTGSGGRRGRNPKSKKWGFQPFDGVFGGAIWSE